MFDYKKNPGPGKSAPRLLNDLLDYDLRTSAKTESQTSTPPPHEKPDTSTLPPHQEPDRTTIYKKAAYFLNADPFELFGILNFKLGESSQSEEEFAQYWTLPVVDDENREFIDDVKCELYQLMLERPDEEKKLPHGAMTGNVNVTRKNKPYYLDCLREIGNGRRSSDLQMKATMILSTGEASLKDIEKAYSFFALQRSDTKDEADDYIIVFYKSRVDSAPRQKEEARDCLLVIAKDRQNTASDSIEAAAVAMSFEGDKNKVAKALRAIANQRGDDYTLQRAATSMESGTEASNLDVCLRTGAPTGSSDSYTEAFRSSSVLLYGKVCSRVVMNFEQNRMPLNEEDIKKKRVGGRAVSKAEIIKAQKFVTELHDLFENLKTAPTRSIKPTRELAELTIFSSAAEANFRRASISSPNAVNFPPPPTDDDIEMIDRPEDKDSSQRDDSSEGTLVDAPDIDGLPPYSDVLGKTSDATERSGTLRQKTPVVLLMTLSCRLQFLQEIRVAFRYRQRIIKEVITDDDLWKFGSQQDVTEVISKRDVSLQCAIRPTSIDPVSGEQIDNIRDTFYGANASYLRKSQKLEKKVEPWANLIIFPDENKSRDIYEALDVVFDEQQVHIDGTVQPQYASITKLPPILQVQIQRTRYDNVKHTAYKNRNAVVFPETIYLDRYMDSEDPESPLMRRRQEA
ncbi:hypothetical protein EYC84_008888 [Monilinia fructicola]|uniref:ubiquitinyl hydrolase 1 n=1 Tax=Monilinia fructicola TaxID=38448 RepID=A0A5M9JAM4_MONFR|nr:hypothetical protein EYC84_008888 [Monilinia fructicola]